MIETLFVLAFLTVMFTTVALICISRNRQYKQIREILKRG